jgi:hypothetical protein
LRPGFELRRAAPNIFPDFEGPRWYKMCPKGGNGAVFHHMQSSDSSDFGFNFPNLNHRDYASNLFGWELPQAASIQQDFGVSNPFGNYFL